MLTWNVKLLLCSLDLIACIIIALSCILLLVWLDLFVACGVHWSDYSFFLCDLICSPLCVIMLWLWPMWFCHGVHLQYRCDFQLISLYPCFEMSCPCDPHFSCCGWWVGRACDHWWLFLILWLLCLGHLCINLLCLFSSLCVFWGLSKLIWSLRGVDAFDWVWRLIWFAFVWVGACNSPWLQREYDLLYWEISCFGYCPLELKTLCLSSLWLGLRGSWCCILYICIFCFAYSPKSPCFTCYISLYLLNYAYHCARMSSNEMWNSFSRPC
jgi:hypothetical protein